MIPLMTGNPYLARRYFHAFKCVAVASLSIALAAMGTGAARGENWPGWRGPRGDGTSLEQPVPLRWSANENLAWKTPLPGEGHSSPIVWGERIFLTTALKETQERVLLCFEASSGKLLWQETVLRAPLEDKNAENSYASATPATDGQRVYVTFLDGKDVVVAAHDFNGRQLWRVRPGQFQAVWGFSHNPMLFEDRVIVNCDSKGENFLVAVSCADGRTLWKTPRQNGTHSYSAPLIRKPGRPPPGGGGRRQGGDGLRSAEWQDVMGRGRPLGGLRGHARFQRGGGPGPELQQLAQARADRH